MPGAHRTPRPSTRAADTDSGRVRHRRTARPGVAGRRRSPRPGRRAPRSPRRPASAPGERRSVRFALAWDLSMVEFGAGRRWWKRYTRDWGRTGDRAWDLARHAPRAGRPWRAAIEAWQAPVLDDPERPGWYRAALFNELYFLVDGGTFWEAGEVGGPEPRSRRRRAVRAPRVRRLPVLRHGRRRLLRVVRDPRAVPGAGGTRDPRPARATRGDDATVTIEASGVTAARKAPGAVPHDVGGPADDPFHRPNWYRFQDVNVWKDLARSSSSRLARRRRLADDEP